MERPPSRTAASVDALLNTLSPFQVAESIRSFASRLSPTDVSGIVASSLSAMDGFERAQLGMAFGAPRAGASASAFDEPAIGDDELLALVDGAGTDAPDRFGRFLSQNVRSLHVLDDRTLRAILKPVSHGSVRFAPLRQPADFAPKPRRRGVLAAVAAASFLAAGAIGFGVSHRVERTPQLQPEPAATAKAARTLPPAVRRSPVAARVVAVRPEPTPSAAPTAAPSAAPTQTPAPASTPAPTPTASPNPPSPAPTVGVEDRARNAVLYYLRSTQQRNSQFTILNSAFDGRATRVIVNVDGPDGHFLGEYTVLQRGSRMDIVDQNLTPQ